MFKSYESLRIVEYELNETISQLNRVQSMQTDQLTTEKHVFESELKITKAEKSDLQLAYLHAQENLN